ncbi:SRPBCC domain-containing protein [uncultured Parasphingopyxis sp.]|uniref:SRPBCC family protein n=1 Tax=uncultured Parasphingopyxis sp. TaxID=1547918 RepID=UPI002628E66F|nr:SRPBCC domain-containing protein [uncultured Parasphingopyxis sp.]
MRVWAIAAMVGLALAVPVKAEVETSDHGFVATNTADIAAPPGEVWNALIDPARYWNAEHSWFGDAANFSLEPVAGGCFCETSEQGSVEHQRVVMAMPDRLLRLSGALGPLQSEALAATLTWDLAATPEGTRITQTYVVGGHMRFPVDQIAPAVDGVVREQLERLAALFDQPTE